ncbi:hypothetical protein OG21DRAFT_1516877 [Imleria badia]|nr:hypothetical protein OG21DRAFT_1516877 [Imleria badia]
MHPGVLRGTAYGSARAIKACDVIERLRVAASGKKWLKLCHGATFALETLPSVLGRPFERYMMFILPILLMVRDGTADMRELAEDAVRAIMGNMSGYGVKLILQDTGSTGNEIDS